MASSVRRKIVGVDMFIAALNIAIGIMMGTAAFAAELWWVGLVVAVVTVVLLAAADRSRAGIWAMVAVFAVGMVALIWTDTFSISIMSLVILGLAAGMAVNRLLFGVVGPIPEARRRREQMDWYDWF
jgi:apolipoprotein N-acyltransferase